MYESDEKVVERICAAIKLMSWSETKELGLNQQQVMKIKKGQKVRFYGKTFLRLKKRFAPAS